MPVIRAAKLFEAYFHLEQNRLLRIEPDDGAALVLEDDGTLGLLARVMSAAAAAKPATRRKAGSIRAGFSLDSGLAVALASMVQASPPHRGDLSIEASLGSDSNSVREAAHTRPVPCRR